MRRISQQEQLVMESFSKRNIAHTTVRVDGVWRVLQVRGVTRKTNHARLNVDAEEVVC